MGYFIEKFDNILDFGENKIDTLYEEFCDYKSLPTTELPDTTLTDVLIKSDENDEYEWRWISYGCYIVPPLPNEEPYRKQFQIPQSVWYRSHRVINAPLNAGIERVYSLVNKSKNYGSDRNRMDIDGSLLAILAVKLDQPE